MIALMDAPRLTRSKGGCFAAGCWVIGILLAVAGLFMWPMLIPAVGLMILGSLSDKTSSYCGACGNTVAPTSRMCPTCQAHLSAPQTSPLAYLVKMGWIAVLLFITLGTIWLVMNQPR
jgi:hypothetical protein